MTSPLPTGNALTACLITSHRAISSLLYSDAEYRDDARNGIPTGWIWDQPTCGSVASRYGLLGCGAVQFGRWVSTFKTNLLPSYAGRT